MILPAIVVKVIGFIDQNGGMHKKPFIDSNIVRTQLDNGQIVNVKHYSGNKNFSSLKDYLENKAQLGIKADKKKSLVGDILLDDNPIIDTMMNKSIQTVSAHNPSLTGKALNKEAAGIVAEKILKNRQLVQSSGIIRHALAFKDDLVEPNVKSIYTKFKDGHLTYDTSGVYSHGMLPTHIPVEIEAIVGNDGIFRNLFKMTTSSLIRGTQCLQIAEHCSRTVKHCMPAMGMVNTSPVYLPYIFNERNYPPFVKRMNDINKINQKLNKEQFLDALFIDEYYNLSLKFVKLLKDTPAYYRYFKLQIPLLMDTTKYENGMKFINPNGSKSPMQMFRKAAINMNFNKESDQTKSMLQNYILKEFILKMPTGAYRPKLLLTYNLAGNEILGEGTSWGFMHQNIDFSKMTFGINDARFMIDSCSQYLENLKNNNMLPQ